MGLNLVVPVVVVVVAPALPAPTTSARSREPRIKRLLIVPTVLFLEEEEEDPRDTIFVSNTLYTVLVSTIQYTFFREILNKYNNTMPFYFVNNITGGLN